MLLHGKHIGKVEQRTDPLRLGRLKLRIVGIHSDEIKVEHLPWAMPNTETSQGGGHIGIPPLDSWVWVGFQQGNHEYPIWEGGWWGHHEGKPETAADTSQKVQPEWRDWSPSWFGGERIKEGPLRMETDPSLRPEDQPNNYSYISPLGKRYEFDDRFGQEQVVLGDQLDNMLRINSEWGVATLEVGRGLQRDSGAEYRKVGFTLSSNETDDLQAWQFYTHKGWRMTTQASSGIFEVCSPNGAKFRIESGSDTETIQMWTTGGYYGVFDETQKIIVLSTPSKKRLVLDESAEGGFQLVSQKGSIRVTDADGIMELNSTDGINLKTLGNINLSAAGKVTIDGVEGVFIIEDSDTLPSNGVNLDLEMNTELQRIPFSLPASQEQIARAMDYPLDTD